MSGPQEAVMELQLGEPPIHLIKFAEDELNERVENKTRDLKELREKVLANPKLNLRTDDDYLIRFLRARAFDTEEAYKLAERYCDLRKKESRFFQDVKPDDLMYLGDDGVISVPPHRDQRGRRIIILRIGRWKPSKNPLSDVMKAVMIIMELGCLEPATQIAGGVAILDLKDLGLEHVTHFNPRLSKFMLDFIRFIFPLRTSGFHIVNQPVVFPLLFAIFKPFLDKEFSEKIHVHGQNFKDLHEFIDREYLPEIYGGNKPEYNYRTWIDNIDNNEKVTKELTRLGYDLTKNDPAAVQEKKK